MPEPSGILAEAARRVWKYQRVVWWLFAGNLVLALLAGTPFVSRLGRVSGHSLHAQRLVAGFDLGAYSELAANPDAAFAARGAEAMPAIFVFFIFALFLIGGTLVAYSNEYKLGAANFFEACGAYFWRLVRLLLFMLVVLVPLAILDAVVLHPALRLILDGAGPEAVPYVLIFIILLATALVLMSIRLWFDMAQVRAVLDDERVMRRNLVAAFRLTRANFGSLFWLYFRISFLGWLVLGAGMYLWTRIPGRYSFVSFLVLEAVLLWWIGTRLWQRAAETVWYQRHVTSVAPSVSIPGPETVSASENPYSANSDQ